LGYRAEDAEGTKIGLILGKSGDNFCEVFGNSAGSIYNSVGVIYTWLSKSIEESSNYQIDKKYGK